MGRKHRQPKLRLDRGKYYCATIYKPDGKRTNVSFGTIEQNSYGQVMVVFEKWFDLYQQQPHKVLSFKDPFDAVKEMVNPVYSDL